MSLNKILEDKGKAADPAIAGDVSDAIARLVDADRSLAEIALADAQEALAALDPEHNKAKKVAKEIAKVELEKGKSDKAIDHYKKAWEHAGNAEKHATEELGIL